jgi:hypothetical protein
VMRAVPTAKLVPIMGCEEVWSIMWMDSAAIQSSPAGGM